jgi:hypothetical protein
MVTNSLGIITIVMVFCAAPTPVIICISWPKQADSCRTGKAERPWIPTIRASQSPRNEVYRMTAVRL